MGKKTQEKTQGDPEGRNAKASGLLKRWGPILAIIALAGVVYLNSWHEYLSLSKIAENREYLQEFVEANLALAVLVYSIGYIMLVTFSLPGGAVATITGGFLFGWLICGLVGVLAATTGATILFLAVRTSLGDALRARANARVQALADGFNENALSYLLFLRLVPAFPFWLVNLAPALLGVSLRTYVIGTFIGIIPGTFAFAFLGAGLGSIIDAQKEANDACIAEKGAEACPFSIDLGSIISWELLLAFTTLGIVAILPVIIQKIRARKSA